MQNSNDKKSVSVLAIIPARGGSKGIPKKNIVDVCGKPLIAYAIEAAHTASTVDAVLVSTDDPEIQAVAMAYGGDAPFLRPAELATDDARDIGFLQHALEWVRQERGWKPDIIVQLPPTSPTRTSKDIDAAVMLLQQTQATSVRTVVHPPHFNPSKMWVAADEEDTIVPLLPAGMQAVPRQLLPLWYMPVGIAYVMRSELIRQGVMWGDRVKALRIPLARYSDIDDLQDLEEATAIVMKLGKI